MNHENEDHVQKHPQGEQSADRAEAGHPFACRPAGEGQNGSTDPGARASSGTDVLRAMGRDPRCVFLYWRLEGPTGKKLRSEPRWRARWAINLQNITTREERMVPVDADAGNYYMEVSGGCSYVFELGVLAEGRFHAACRSNRVTTPSDRSEPGGPPEEAEEDGQSRRTAAESCDRRSTEEAGEQLVGLTYESTRDRLTSSASSDSFVKR